MFGKVKRWLGIEGIKLELILPLEVDKSLGLVEGQIRLYSMHTQKISALKVVVKERFARGRKGDKLIDEFQLGEISLEKEIEIPANEPISIDFSVPFALMKSEMDELQDKNPIIGGVVQAAKWIKGVNSEYRVEAEANAIGTALNPYDKKVINFV